MIRLENVIDIRTGRFYSVVVISERKAKYFIPAEPNEEE